MAVYTEVSPTALSNLLDGFALGIPIRFEGISSGVENTNYLLETTLGRYILTLYEKRVDARELPFFLGLKQWLAQQGLPVPRPVADRDGQALQQVSGRAGAIFTFLNGEECGSIGTEQCRQVGEMLARLHLVAPAPSPRRQNNLSVDAWPGRSWTGTVTYLRDTVDPDSRTVRARIEVANPDGALRPEMFAAVQLSDPHHDDAEAPEVLAVPDEAVQRGASGSVVYVQTGAGVYEQRDVRLGHRSGGFAEVLSGLQPGEQVVVAGSFLLKTEASRESLGGGHSH